MTRDVALGLGVLSIALVACGGGSRPASNSESSGDDWTVMNRKDMGEDAYKLPTYFARLSEKHGCQVKETDEVSLAKCSEGTIGMLRQGTTITIACKSMSKSACSTLFDNIVAEGK